MTECQYVLPPPLLTLVKARIGTRKTLSERARRSIRRLDLFSLRPCLRGFGQHDDFRMGRFPTFV